MDGSVISELLVERRPDLDDRRATLLLARTTPCGVGSMRRARSDRLDQRLSSWSDKDLEGFAAQLAAYNAALADD